MELGLTSVRQAKDVAPQKHSQPTVHHLRRLDHRREWRTACGRTVKHQPAV